MGKGCGHEHDFLGCGIGAFVEADGAGYKDIGALELLDAAGDPRETDADRL